MDFGFSEEQDLLRGEVRKLLDARCPMEKVRKLAETPEGYDAQLWRELSEAGFVGLTVPEAHGGGGLETLDLLVVLEETGRSLFPSPLLSTNLAISAIARFGSEAQKKRFLPGLADGSRIGTLAVLEKSDLREARGIELRGRAEGDGYVLSGTKHFVSDVGSADLFVVAFRTGDTPEDLTLAVIEKSASARGEAQKTMDRTKRVGNLVLEGARVSRDDLLGEPNKAWPAIEHLLDRGAVLVCAESIGAAEGVHRITVEYAKTRVQFDHPIGKYQGVKHPLAEMYVDIESIKSLTYYAAWVSDHRPLELARSASRAKAYLSDAFARIGIDSIQLHGAIGYTWELDVQMYMKRAKWARPAFGDGDYHYQRIASLGGL